MKLLPAMAVLLLGLSASSTAFSRELVVAVSPYVAPAAATQQAKDILKFLTELEPGDQAVIVNGYHLGLIGEFTIPDDPKYRSPKARLGANRSAVSSLLRFAKSAQAPGGQDKPTVTGALRLPQLLRYIAENFPASSQQDVLIIGSPLYEDLDTPTLSMTDERFPGDGHLFSTTGKTPYGTPGNSALFANLLIHIGYGDQGMTGSDRHDHFILRYWTLFIEQQGGMLSSFVADLPTLFRQVKRNAAPLKHDYSPVRTEKLEIIRLTPTEVKQSIYERPITTTPLVAAKVRRAEQLEIGITWDCDTCDLDLLAKAHPGAQVLYFGHTVSPEGRYWKDYQNSPELTKGRETIAFTVPLDLRVLRIAVNFYGGVAPKGVNGELRLSIDGNTYAAAFHIDANAGNQGNGMERAMDVGKANSKHTVFINPLAIVGTN